jgi:hypothetical protein
MARLKVRKAPAEAFLSLRRMIYNYVRTHQGLISTPAEAADIRLDLRKNRLLNLIRLSSEAQSTHLFSAKLRSAVAILPKCGKDNVMKSHPCVEEKQPQQIFFV